MNGGGNPRQINFLLQGDDGFFDGTARFHLQVRAGELLEGEGGGDVRFQRTVRGPPKVEYSLTKKGETLRSILLALRDWGLETVPETIKECQG